MDNCLFCKIIKGDIPSTCVYQDEKTYAFRDIAPWPPPMCWWCPRPT